MTGSLFKRPLKRNVSFRHLPWKPSAWPSYARALDAYLREPLRVSEDVLRVQVEPTLRCNLRCVMCHPEKRTAPAADMSLPVFREVLGLFPRLRNLILQGLGEPLLNPDFFAMVREARSRGIFVQTFTNGTLLRENGVPERLLDTGLNVLNLSLDSCDPEVYEGMRRGAVFEQVAEGVRTLAERVKKEKAPLRLNLWIVQTRQNRRTIPDTVLFAGTLGIRRVIVQPEHAWGVPRAAEPLAPGQGVDAAPLRALAMRNGIDLDVLAGPGRRRRCKWPWMSPYITVEGYVTPCCMLGADPRKLHFGNIHEQPFRKIWNGKAIRRFREEMKSGSPPALCAGCPAY